MTATPSPKKLLFAMTGASGMLFVVSFLEMLVGRDVVVHGISSSSGREVLWVRVPPALQQCSQQF